MSRVCCRSLAARLSARVSELVLSEQHARMAVPAPTERKPDGPSVEALQRRIGALEAQVYEKDEVSLPSRGMYIACSLRSLLCLEGERDAVAEPCSAVDRSFRPSRSSWRHRVRHRTHKVMLRPRLSETLVALWTNSTWPGLHLMRAHPNR